MMNKQDRLVAAWYVPTPTMGGGGFRTILQNASRSLAMDTAMTFM